MSTASSTSQTSGEDFDDEEEDGGYYQDDDYDIDDDDDDMGFENEVKAKETYVHDANTKTQMYKQEFKAVLKIRVLKVGYHSFKVGTSSLASPLETYSKFVSQMVDRKMTCDRPLF